MILALLLLTACQERPDFARALREIDAALGARKAPLTEKELGDFAANFDAHVAFIGMGQLDKSMQCLARAEAIASGRAVAYPDSLRLLVPTVLEADAVAPISARVHQMFEVPPPDGLKTRLVLSVGTEIVAESADLQPVRAKIAWKEGVVWAELFLGDAKDPALREAIFIVPDLERRMKAAKTAIDALVVNETYYTLKHQWGLLDALRKGERMEAPPVFPLMLKRIEDDLASIADKEDPFAGRTGDLLRATRSGIHEVIYRVYVPSRYDPDDPAPLVVALHPGGGSEHTYLDTVGGGMIKALAEERGWIVASPRGPLTDAEPDFVFALVDGLSKAYAIDPKKIFITGHSAGASLALRAMAERPKLFRAVAAVGGFCHVEYADMRDVAIYLAAGAYQRGIKEFRLEAKRAVNHPAFQFDERPDADAFLIAPLTLPAVFKWFDENQEP